MGDTEGQTGIILPLHPWITRANKSNGHAMRYWSYYLELPSIILLLVQENNKIGPVCSDLLHDNISTVVSI